MAMPHYSQAFLDGERATTYLSNEVRQKLLLSVTEEITSRYYSQASELVNVVRISYMSTNVVYLFVLKAFL